MRILLAVHGFPPRSTAGVEVYTLRLAKALCGLGHEVLVLAAVHDLGDEPGALRRRIHEGVDVSEIVNVHHRGTLEATYADPDVDRAAAVVLRAFRPDVVHAQHLLNLSIGLLADARQYASAVLLTLHDYWLGCPRDGLRMREDLALCEAIDHGVCASCLQGSPYLVPPLQRGAAAIARRAGLGRHLHHLHDLAPTLTGRLTAIARRLRPARSSRLASAMDLRALRLRESLRGVDRVLAPTQFARARAREFGVEENRLETAPLAVLTEPARARRAGKRKRFGFVGTLAPHKGVHVLVRAFRSHASADATLDLFGGTETHPAYVAKLRQEASGDLRIRLRGGFPEGEQERVLAQLDALILPSIWWENSPLTVLEALGAGLPVIASRTGGVPELLQDGSSGVLVPPGDADALGEALLALAEGRLLSESLDPLPLKTAVQGASDLLALYARIVDERRTA
jgi:glycosyltransferase involved in cell wall biosynthesis